MKLSVDFAVEQYNKPINGECFGTYSVLTNFSREPTKLATVFTGKVAIPFDKIDKYIKT